MAHLDDQLEHEGGPAAETLHSIAGGLQVGPSFHHHLNQGSLAENNPKFKKQRR